MAEHPTVNRTVVGSSPATPAGGMNGYCHGGDSP